MKPVQGYMSDDGTFFESKLEATRHDYEMQIRAYCVSHTPTIDAEKLMYHLEALADTATGYIDVTRQIEAHSSVASQAVAYQADEQEPEKAPPVFEQSLGGHEPMSNVGSSSLPKGVQHEQPTDGPRGRRRNA